MAGNLYKRLDEHNFLRFNPITDRYDIVSAGEVPRLTQVVERARLSVSERRSDPGALVRRLCILAMIDAQEQFTTIGKPKAAETPLRALVHLAGDPSEQTQLRLPWRSLPANPAEVANSGDPARALAVLNQAVTPTIPELNAAVVVLPHFAIAELRTSRAKCDAAWGGVKLRAGGLIDKLVQFAREKSDAAVPAARMSLTRARKPGTYLRL